MHGKYDYIIESIINKREDGKVNPYHSQIVGERCAIGDLDTGTKCALLIERFNLENVPYNRWYYTSCVTDIRSDNGVVIFDTVNSTYMLRLVENGN